MTKTPKWETIEIDGKDIRTYVLSINGGNIYRFVIANNNSHFIFVPDNTTVPTIDHKYIDELINNIANLSMKINKMQSDLREFEKQRHNVLVERVTLVKEVLSSHDCRINDLYSRIEKLEESIANQVDHENCNAYRILKLEKNICIHGAPAKACTQCVSM